MQYALAGGEWAHRIEIDGLDELQDLTQLGLFKHITDGWFGSAGNPANRYIVSDEGREWMHSHVGVREEAWSVYRYVNHIRIAMLFRHKRDAMAFKLAWTP